MLMGCQGVWTSGKKASNVDDMAYVASCHCGAVTLEVKRAPRSITDCNCSICRRYGALWAYYNESTVRVRSVRGALMRYAWGRKKIVFNRCAHCGCVTHHQRARKTATSTVGVNARLFAPEIVAKARVRKLDGAATWKYLD